MNEHELTQIYHSFYDQLLPDDCKLAKEEFDYEYSRGYSIPNDLKSAITRTPWLSEGNCTVFSDIVARLNRGTYPLQLTPQACKTKAREVMYGESKASQIFPEDDEERQKYAVGTFICEFFPHAIAELARFSHDMQQKHNPDKPMGWAKDKSVGNGNQIFRHQMDGEFREVAWRGLEQLERFLMKMPPFEK